MMIAFENGDGAVIMTNGMRGWQLVREILPGIAAEYNWPYGQSKTRPRMTVSPQLMEPLVGTYEITPAFRIVVSRRNDRLFAQLTGLQRFEIFPESDRDFFFKVVDAVISFDTDGQATAPQLTFRLNGTDRIGKRVP